MTSVEFVNDECDMALTHIQLVGPLLPDSKLAVIFIGTPQRSSQVRARRRIEEAAARFHAHEKDGIVTVCIYFVPSIYLSRVGASRDFEVVVTKTQHQKRVSRIMLLMIIGLVVYGVLTILIKRVCMR